MTQDRHWFEDIADHVGSAYLRYSFTKGTENEVDFLVDALALEPGMRVVDLGCGPGRHAHALGARGIEVLGLDISATFIDLASSRATPGVSFRVGDARALELDASEVASFDAVISLCQGGFGLSGGPSTVPARRLDPDLDVLDGVCRLLKPGGHLGLSAFSAYFQVRYLEAADTFDAASGVNHERTTVKNEAGEEAERDLWTTCFTPKELRLLAAHAGLEVVHLWSVTPGNYGRREPNLDEPELFVVARKRGRGAAG